VITNAAAAITATNTAIPPVGSPRFSGGAGVCARSGVRGRGDGAERRIGVTGGVVCCTPAFSATSMIASRSSTMLCGRASRSFSRQRRISASSSAGIGASDDGLGGGSLMCADTVSTYEGNSNGSSPVNISNMITPSP
jgi:hypothetical protein